MKLFTVDTGFFKLDGGAMFGVVPKSIWSKLNAPDENNMCTWAMRCLLADTGERRVLVDTGIGSKQSDKFFGYYSLHGEASLESSLAKLGYAPEDITDVLLTHLHFDHCGGAVKKKEDQLIPTFPNAKYHCNRAQWEWAVNPNPREKASFLSENILPLKDAGCLALFETGDEPIPGMGLIHVSGHTESMTLPYFQYKGTQIYYMADLIPSMAHVPIPYVMAYDVRPLQTMKEKASILQTVLETNAYLFFEHDPQVEMCQLTRGEKGIMAHRPMKLADL
ncbi:MAG: MBL fold metallo-hydrolase [Bacteroidota bacterium]|jgi:glyoxylase-like metal-dependent hydrolase (beta-lactamase superfamily II)